MKQVPKVIFGRGSFKKLPEVLASYRSDGYVIFFVDHAHKKTGLVDLIPSEKDDLVFVVDTSSHEPKTDQVDELRDGILKIKKGNLPALIIGIGGGSAMDISKAVSIMLTNEGSSKLYQGWDLVKNAPIRKMGIPTLSGAGTEASRTTVLSAVDKKYGINSDQSMFDIVMMDPDLLDNVPEDQKFFTGMDCFIHGVEASEGSYINTFGSAYAKQSLELCTKVFLKQGGTNDDLMVASFLGGASVTNSEAGVVHAMSYGISLVLGYRHGLANCIVFRQLEEFYPKHVPIFFKMLELNNIKLPDGVTKKVNEEEMAVMTKMTYRMARPLTSALGENWKDILTEEKIANLYAKM